MVSGDFLFFYFFCPQNNSVCYSMLELVLYLRGIAHYIAHIHLDI